MNIHSFNVNGLRAIMGKGFLDYINKYNPDILCIQETKLQEGNLTESIREIDGYKSYFSHASKKGYSGVAVYTKYEPISVKYGIGIEEFDSEGRILICEFEKFTLLNIYFPNGQKDEIRLDYKLRFYDALLNYINEESKNGKNIIVCGDYNTAHTEMDIKNAKANEKTSGFLKIEREWIDKYIENGYLDVFRELNSDLVKYSWWSYRFKARERNTGWRIDYHLVSKSIMPFIKSAEILNEVLGSDHCPVTIEIETENI